MKKVFSYRKFVTDVLLFTETDEELMLHLSCTWMYDCIDKEVVDGMCGVYDVNDDWCEEVED